MRGHLVSHPARRAKRALRQDGDIGGEAIREGDPALRFRKGPEKILHVFGSTPAQMSAEEASAEMTQRHRQPAGVFGRE